jgi:hypothetical protein
MGYIGAGVTRFNTADELTVTGDAQIDTTTLVVDSTNNRVGIGTALPGVKLENAGSFRSTSVTDPTSGAGLELCWRGTSADVLSYDRDTSQFKELQIRGAPVKFLNAGGERMRIDSSGNVGISNTSPAQKLAVGGTASGTVALQVTNSTAGTAFNNGMQMFINDTAGGLNMREAYPLQFYVNGSERLRITSVGDVGIGRNDPQNIVGSHGGGLVVKSASGRAATTAQIAFQDSSGNNQFVQLHNGQTTFATGSTERMRIDSSGNLLVGTTDQLAGINGSTEQGVGISSGSYGGVVLVSRSGNAPIIANRQTSDGEIINLRKDGTTVGSISVTGSGTTYNTTSDIRLKTDIQPIADATDKLMQMQPVTHKWIADPDADAVHGFIAQEMQQICPEAVSGEDGGEDMMSMDYGRITPVLVAALQEAHRKIKELEQRLSEMEN